MGTLENGLIHRSRFASRNQSRFAIFDYIEIFYNRVSIHSSLSLKSSVDYESNLN